MPCGRCLRISRVNVRASLVGWHGKKNTETQKEMVVVLQLNQGYLWPSRLLGVSESGGFLNWDLPVTKTNATCRGGRLPRRLHAVFLSPPHASHNSSSFPRTSNKTRPSLGEAAHSDCGLPQGRPCLQSPFHNEQIWPVLNCIISPNCSKVVTDHVGNLLSSWKSAVLLSSLLFDTDSSSEVRIGDNNLQCRRYLRFKDFKIWENLFLQLTATSQDHLLVLQSLLL